MSFSPSARIVILGAGHAGGACAALLRQYGHEGTISLVGDEPIPPYQRPPLSKAWLKGEADAESLALRPLSFYADNDIQFHPHSARVRMKLDVVVGVERQGPTTTSSFIRTRALCGSTAPTNWSTVRMVG